MSGPHDGGNGLEDYEEVESKPWPVGVIILAVVLFLIALGSLYSC